MKNMQGRTDGGTKNIDVILSDKAFDCFDAEKKALIKQMYNEMQGKSVEGIMLVFTKYYGRVFSGKKISVEERDAMLRVLMADMSEADKNKLYSVLRMLKMK
jgi:hypothetical protein